MKAFPSPAARALLRAAVLASTTLSCYSGGGRGRPPPATTFYFPTGLAVSADGNVLYAANSDFDLQWNGGTLQSYDLQQLRGDAALLIQANLSGPNASRPDIPFIDPTQWHPNCQQRPPSGGMFLGEACSPPVDSGHYFRHSVTIGAFAADVQVSVADAGAPARLFAPVGGDESLTWADVGLGADPNHPGDEFAIVCGQDSVGRCDAKHRVGNDPNQAGDTRQVTMPDGPFGMAQTPDGKAIALTHQTAAAISLATTGFAVAPPDLPALKFVLAALDAGLPSPPIGGSGMAAVPHDPDGPEKPCELVADTPPCLRPAFLETFHSTPEVDLLRFYDDANGTPLPQPFIQREGIFSLTANAMGTDSRGIVVDPTPSIACKAQGLLDPATCALQNPARVFFASRTPPALTIGHIGDFQISDGTYDPDQLVLTGNVPLPAGPSKVYLAPIVNQAGAFELRVFVVLFDSSQIAVFDPSVPDDSALTVINVGPNPGAMAFDAFSFQDVGQKGVAANASTPYRFAYVASFTQSYVQVIDLDNSQPTADTFERVVFTLGNPTLPIGQQSQQQSPGFL